MIQYGELVRQGIDIALAEHQQQGGRAIELVTVDDGGSAGRAGAAVDELERAGVIAVIGPLLPEALASAAAARDDERLALLSPTAPDRPNAPHTYALNTEDVRGARALAEYTVQQGRRRVGVLYPRTADFRELAQAFGEALRTAGGEVTADVGYDPATTTFARPIEQLLGSGVDAVYAPAPERIIRQLAPQFEYYGLGGVPLMGSDAWTSDEVLRSVSPRVLEGTVATTALPRGSSEVAWDRFVGLYEAAHRRTLDTPYPALGYDATALVLGALADGDSPGPADIARGLAGTTAFRGATGVLSLEDGTVTRKPFLVRIQSGRLVPLPEGGS